MVFEDELEPSVASSSDFASSEDSFSCARAAAVGAGLGAGSGKSLQHDGSSRSGARVRQSSPESTLPSSTSPTPPRYGGGHGVAAVAVSGWRDPKQSAPKDRPVELAMPVPRSPVVARTATATGSGDSGRNRPAFSAPADSPSDDGEAWRRAGRGEHASAVSGAGSAAMSRGRSRRSNGSSNDRSGHHHRHHHHHHHHDDAASHIGKSKPSR